MRSELQEKNVIIKSLIALNSKSNTTSKQVFSEPPINTYPNLNNDKNSKSLLNVPGKESSIDFQESHVVQPEEEHRVLIPLSDREEESDTSVSDKQSKAETVPLRDAIINKNEQKDILAKKEGINKKNDGLEPAEKTSDEKRIFILGDSIIKNVNGYEISGKTDHSRVYIRPSLSAKVRCMEDHIKPVLRNKPDHIIFHIGTNDIQSNKNSEDIANSIIELVLSAKSESCDASISNIVVGKDRHQNKCQEVNDHLKEKCREKNINLIDQSKSIKPQHLNKTRLHLTKKGTSILSSTFIREIKNIFQLQSLLHSHQNVRTSFNSAEYKSKIANQNINSTNLQNIRLKNINKLIFAHLNINSIRNKFNFVIKDISNNVDFLLISETKTDGSFPKSQFQIKGFSDPFRVDRNTHGSGILFYAREDIPVKLLSVENLPRECFFIEINLRKRKWLVCSYNPHRDNIKDHLNTISANLDLHSSKYEYIIVIGDFNVEVNDKFMSNFCESYNLISLIKESTCYKNPENPSCIDLILANSPHSFQCPSVVETGLSDFHKMIVTVMKTTFQRMPAKIRNYRDYRHYDINIFRESILYELAKESVSNTDLNKFIEICLETLNNYAPSKKKYNRGNQMPFVNKDLSKAIMNRTRFRNKFLKNRNDENRKKYSEQRNYCYLYLEKLKSNTMGI